MQNGAAVVKFDGVSALLDGWVSSGLLAGASVLIQQSGKELLYHGAGLSDIASTDPLARNAIFRLYSMTKPITAGAIMILVDDGVLHLEDVVTEYVPELIGLGVYTGQDGDDVHTLLADPIHIEQLLTHTAGFSYWFYPDQPVAALYANDPGIGAHEDWRFDPKLGLLNGLARSLARLPLVSQPGAKWHYSMSLDVAGIVIERVTGEPLSKFLETRIFEPLAMNDTAFSVAPGQEDRLTSLYKPEESGGIKLVESGDDSSLLKPVPGFSGGGGLVSTINDYGRFAEMLRGGGELDGHRVLSESSARAIMTNRLNRDQLVELPEFAPWGLAGTGDGLGIGYGGAVVLDPPVNGIPTYRGEYSWAGAAGTTFWVDPQNQLTVVFMTQLIPPSTVMVRDELHSAVYKAMGLAGDATDGQ